MPHPRYSKDEIATRGEMLYEQKIRQEVGKEENIGKFLVIDIETGDYEMDDNDLAASQRAHARHPGGAFYGKKIGYRTSGTLGGSWERVEL